MDGLTSLGWAKVALDTRLSEWLKRARGPALATLADPDHDRWYRHGRTWFAGVNVLGNDETGAIAGSGPLRGTLIEALSARFGPISWDRGQVSVTFPGYPRQDPDESTAAHRFRRRRDAAHLDGLLPTGSDRRRHLREHHRFILGLPLTWADPGASPLVVWEGSHEILRAMLIRAFSDRDPGTWRAEDLTDIYQATRARIFETCTRVELSATPGEALLVHRFALHGVAPWADGAGADHHGRAILYFRPEWTGPLDAWLTDP